MNDERNHSFLGKFPLSIFLVVLLGILLRVVVYLINSPLCHDEAMVANAIIHRSFVDLYLPLYKYELAAPLGILFTFKIATHFLGSGEYVLRFFPFLASIASLLIFSSIAKNILSRKGYFYALLLFATSYYLAGYAAEAKQYATDVFFAVLLLKFLLWIDENELCLHRDIIAILVGIISTWFSFPAVFLLFLIGTYLLARAILLRKHRRIPIIILICLFWFMNFAVYYYTFFLKEASRSIYLHKWWSDGGGFPVFPLKSLKDLMWFFNAPLDFFADPIGIFPGIGIFIYILGIILLFRDDRKKYYFVFVPVLFSFWLASIHIWPFYGRAVIFLCPFVIVVLAKGAVFLEALLIKRFGKIVAILMVIALCGKSFSLFMNSLIMHRPDGSRYAVQYILQHIKPADAVVVGRYSKHQFQYYTRGKNIRFEIISSSHPWLNDAAIPSWASSSYCLKEYIADAKRLLNYKQKVWIFIVGCPQTEREILYSFFSGMGKGKIEQRFSSLNAHVLLYDPTADTHNENN